MAQTYSKTHPYFPEGVEIFGYAPNATPLPVLLAAFGSTLSIVITGSLLVARTVNRRLTLADQGLFCWFIQSTFS